MCLQEPLCTDVLEDSCTFPSILHILSLRRTDSQVSAWEIRVVLYFT